MSTLTKTKNTLDKSTPADVVQMTILLDRSGSMDTVWSSAISGLIKLRETLQCELLSVQVFNTDWEIMKDFHEAEENTDSLHPEGGTNLYGAILSAIAHSRQAALDTPQFKVHHVFAVITDGESNEHRPEELSEAKREIAKMDVDATFFLLDSSHDQNAGSKLGWTSTGFSNTPRSITDAIKKIQKALGQISDNIANKLPPASNLALPPAK